MKSKSIPVSVILLLWINICYPYKSQIIISSDLMCQIMAPSDLSIDIIPGCMTNVLGSIPKPKSL